MGIDGRTAGEQLRGVRSPVVAARWSHPRTARPRCGHSGRL